MLNSRNVAIYTYNIYTWYYLVNLLFTNWKPMLRKCKTKPEHAFYLLLAVHEIIVTFWCRYIGHMETFFINNFVPGMFQ